MSRFKGTVSFWVQMLHFGSRTSALNVSKALDIYNTMPWKNQAIESIKNWTFFAVCPLHTLCCLGVEYNVPFCTKNFIPVM